MAVDASTASDALLGIDTPGVDADPGIPGSITVTAFDSTSRSLAAAANMPVVFIDAVQTQVVMTDATGKATATVYPHPNGYSVLETGLTGTRACR